MDKFSKFKNIEGKERKICNVLNYIKKKILKKMVLVFIKIY